MDTLSKVPDSLIHEKKYIKQTWPFRFFQRVAEAFVPELTEANFGHNAHAQKTEICSFAPGSALHVHERHEAKKVSLKFPKENMASAKLQAK